MQQLIASVLSAAIPKANPDFDSKIGNVRFWLLEFNDKTSQPVREIGLDESGTAIIKMPYKNNYGYWTDNNMLFEDFQERFQTAIISRSDFEKVWDAAFSID